MSVFSIIKRGRAQAKERNVKQAEKEKAESVKLPYKHVPTHAATDALATAPSSWKQEDRSKIREQNRRRSAMAANGMSSRGLPRVGSALAYVSYSAADPSPLLPLPRNYSYSSMPGSWRERAANTPGPGPSEAGDYFNHPRDHKGKGKERMPSFAIGTGGTASMLSSGRASPLPSRVPVNVGVGVGVGAGAGAGAGAGVGMAAGKGPEASSSSEDERETRRQAMKNIAGNSEPKVPSSRDSSTNGERMHRLHPAHARKISESRPPANPDRPSDRHYPPPARSTYFSPSAARPTNRRAHSADMSTQSVPTGVSGPIYGHAPSSAASSATSIGMAISTAPTSAGPTPPPSTTGDFTGFEFQSFQLPALGVGPAVTTRRPRKSSLSDYLRTSSDTVRPTPNESFQEPQPQATSTRWRRLSKSRPQQPDEAERPPSINKIPVRAEPIKKPTLAQTETFMQELNRLESTTLYPLNTFDSPQGSKQNKGKLSKNRNSVISHTENVQTASSGRWSLFRRRNSVSAV
ncbi:hypothetical protein F4777DRAFT_244375 [Nemania sp. FL0916]|nr:hypothetical protein F4777DRAFT_244375 [Nemania sp. FL0916]